jgi:hypothetical protein
LLFWWQFVAYLTWALLTLVVCALTTMSVCSIPLVQVLMFLFGVFGGMCGESSCDVLLPLFMVLWVPISAMLCSAYDVACLHVPRAWIFSSFLLFAWWLMLLLLVKNVLNKICRSTEIASTCTNLLFAFANRVTRCILLLRSIWWKLPKKQWW